MLRESPAARVRAVSNRYAIGTAWYLEPLWIRRPAMVIIHEAVDLRRISASEASSRTRRVPYSIQNRSRVWRVIAIRCKRSRTALDVQR
jgi:hypothetical protein